LLGGLFPYLIAVGNLYSCVSLFEFYCFSLVKSIEAYSNNLMNGAGIDAIFRFLKSSGIPVYNLPFYEQSSSFIVLRNCLYHANGQLAFSRDAERIRRIVSDKLYYQSINRAGKSRKDVEARARIEHTPLGEQLVIDHLLAWHAVFNFRDFFCLVCSHAKNIGLISE
jgi:hypothetical protein